MSPRRCCATDCYNTQLFNKDVAYFAFPKIRYYVDLWAEAAGRQDLKSKSLQLINKYYICSEHFAPYCFADPPFNQRLNITKSPRVIPIPTIFQNNLAKFQTRFGGIRSKNMNNNGDTSDTTTILVIPEQLAKLASEKFGNYGKPIDESTSEDEEYSDSESSSGSEAFWDCENDEHVVEVGQKPDLHVCRLCAISFESVELIHIFADLMVAKAVTFVLAGQVTENDSLSQFVCSGCLDKANECVKHISGFREAQRKQIQMYGGNTNK